jgi:hypothetical protein
MIMLRMEPKAGDCGDDAHSFAGPMTMLGV